MTRFTWDDPEAETTTEAAVRGYDCYTDAYRIEFGPGHVVFRDSDHRVLLARQNSRVDNLQQLPEVDPMSPWEAVKRRAKGTDGPCHSPGCATRDDVVGRPGADHF